MDRPRDIPAPALHRGRSRSRALTTAFVVLLLLSACHRRPEPGIASYHAVSLDGRKVSLGDLRGQVVLLNVWTLWCPPCRSEMQTLERLHRAYEPAGLALVGVNVDARGDVPTVRRFVRSTGVTYGIWLDPDDAVSTHLPAPSLPATWLIGRDGRVVWGHVGALRPDDLELGTALRRALGNEQLARGTGPCPAPRDLLLPRAAGAS